jgi:hypothetical protein
MHRLRCEVKLSDDALRFTRKGQCFEKTMVLPRHLVATLLLTWLALPVISLTPAAASGISLDCGVWHLYIDTDNGSVIAAFLGGRPSTYKLTTFDEQWYRAAESLPTFADGSQLPHGYDEFDSWIAVNRITGLLTIANGTTNPELRAQHKWIPFQGSPATLRCTTSESTYGPKF